MTCLPSTSGFSNNVTVTMVFALKVYRVVCLALYADQSTSDTAVNKEQGSHSASAGPLSSIDDIYCRLKLNFTIDNIQMELFTGDRDSVNFVFVILKALIEVYS